MTQEIKAIDISPYLSRKIWQETGVPPASSEDVLAWLSNNPITPSLDQVSRIVGSYMDKWDSIKFSRLAFAQRVAAFQRFAYLRPEPVYPSELHQKMWTYGYGGISKSMAEEHNARLKEAFELGKSVQKMDGATT